MRCMITPIFQTRKLGPREQKQLVQDRGNALIPRSLSSLQDGTAFQKSPSQMGKHLLGYG